jgi:hypothetical protein
VEWWWWWAVAAAALLPDSLADPQVAISANGLTLNVPSVKGYVVRTAIKKNAKNNQITMVVAYKKDPPSQSKGAVARALKAPVSKIPLPEDVITTLEAFLRKVDCAHMSKDEIGRMYNDAANHCGMHRDLRSKIIGHIRRLRDGAKRLIAQDKPSPWQNLLPSPKLQGAIKNIPPAVDPPADPAPAPVLHSSRGPGVHNNAQNILAGSQVQGGSNKAATGSASQGEVRRTGVVRPAVRGMYSGAGH